MLIFHCVILSVSRRGVRDVNACCFTAFGKLDSNPGALVLYHIAYIYIYLQYMYTMQLFYTISTMNILDIHVNSFIQDLS